MNKKLLALAILAITACGCGKRARAEDIAPDFSAQDITVAADDQGDVAAADESVSFKGGDDAAVDQDDQSAAVLIS